ncbi:hypothetical protein HL658_33715 [Azospirillum sp. RWY-5-1]|uniref:O-antigen ligase domain-containing protein n=1 Tax=Azospirillum oleiclasticum TaxID=2735135 RepID=A0ABX2TJW1_9PROT|nr:hypothetical protein [Azospirillum oleiclasticum]NYZ17527.1 hypothetical protein [Azospirillum oleiclasticum]NYZ24629.1 hypothetical protein [Azospirillum oleiclasticum]
MTAVSSPPGPAAADRFGSGLLACVVAGLPIGLDVELIGRVTGTELVVLVLLPVLLLHGRVPALAGPMRTLIVLALVWLVAQFVSDIANETTADNMLRGAARALVTAFLLLGFFALAGDRPRNLHAIYLAFAVGLLIGARVNPSDYFEADSWKFGYGSGTTMLIVAVAGLAWAWGMRSVAIGICVLAGILNLFMGFRSMAGMAVMTGLLLGLSTLLGERSRGTSTLQVVVIFTVLAAGGAGMIELYAEAAQSGLLGLEEQEKYFQQVDERGVLLSGRAEFPVALEAVMERPLLGHGSWAANEHYAIRIWEMSGFHLDDIPFEASDLIPSHSHLMGAWVEAGVFGALFWFYVLLLLARAFVAMVRNGAVADPVLVFTLMNLLWAVFFSPYGLSNRVFGCFAIVVAVTVLRLDARTRADLVPRRPPPHSPIAHRERPGALP